MGFCCLPPTKRDARPAPSRLAHRGSVRAATIESGRRRMELVGRRLPAPGLQPEPSADRPVLALLHHAALLATAADYVAGIGLSRETTREIAAIGRTPRVQREIDRLTGLIASNKDLACFIETPHAKCYEASRVVYDVLFKAGYVTQLRVLGMWDGIGDDLRNHMVVLARMDGVVFFVDITAHQFPEVGIKGPLVDIEPNAMARFIAGGTALIKYCDFSYYGPALAFASYSLLSGAQQPLAGATVLKPFPDWYARSLAERGLA
ncbi:MAG: hypothetical protein EPN57_02225 [Paraburkholderia sp.]|nr:MAG: hypothetical protein EPN57_02225 [Paraburkholderia sp.]